MAGNKPTIEEILKKAVELCGKDGIDWRETSASEASEYMRQAELEIAAGRKPMSDTQAKAAPSKAARELAKEIIIGGFIRDGVHPADLAETIQSALETWKIPNDTVKAKE